MKQKKSIRGRIDDNEPNPVDVHVGKRIRLRRTILHITQQEMAEMLGLTFQQVQKYEKGMNRVGASRLWDISRVLKVPMGFFFEDMDAKVAMQSPRMLQTPLGGEYKVSEQKNSFDDDPMKKEETLQLVRAYYRITNRAVAKQMLDLMIALSKSTAGLARVDGKLKDEDE
ncbi:MAG: helix-turn-helix transcriptional regulator [Alphaproteobacteria bacterium]|nr:helix-turn-helix transcriptional regulator [Alphaproteobacteria bacterium]